jgi:threonine/homoserine/homoserine lactone efflux protein
VLRYILFILATFSLGFISAIPVGAVQVEAARRALHGHIRAALLVSLGALTGDLCYGVLAYFGLFPVLRERVVMAWFWLIGGVFVVFLAYGLFSQGLRQVEVRERSRLARHRGRAFFTGLVLAFSNPLMILWWLLGERFLNTLGLVKVFDRTTAIEVLAVGGLGMFAYPAILSFTLYWLHRSIPERFIMKMSTVSAVALFLFALYLIGRSLVILLGG